MDIEVESVANAVKQKITAYTATRVTWTMSAFDKSKCTQRWLYPWNINFLRTAKRSVDDVLIGLDCADLHCPIREVWGRPREAIARLTPLGWSCLDNPGSVGRTIAQIHFASTYFVKDRAEIEELNSNLKRYWEIEEMPLVGTGTVGYKPIVRIEEQWAMKKIEQSIGFENNMYRVGVPWRSNERTLPNNYGMALRRLENTEKKKLARSPAIATAYR